jgi:hypothetical protein
LTLDTILAIAGLILALIAMVMAAPPLFQMFLGGPKLDFAADEFTGPDGKQIIISIKNNPVTSSIIRALGVKRDVPDLLAYFDIQEQGTNRFVIKDISAKLESAATRENGLSVRALPGFTVGFPVVHTRGDTTWIVDGRSEGDLPVIAAGDYTALATVVCGDRVSQIARKFKVGTEQHLTFWV